MTYTIHDQLDDLDTLRAYQAQRGVNHEPLAEGKPRTDQREITTAVTNTAQQRRD